MVRTVRSLSWLISIAWRNLLHRGLASILTTVSMALGVMMIVVVLLIYGIVSQSFTNNATLGYNQIVAARGDKLQITLNSVYYLSAPVDNVSYASYLEFQPPEVRRREWEDSLTYAADRVLAEAVRDVTRLDPLADGATTGPDLLAALGEASNADRPWNAPGKYYRAASMTLDPETGEPVMSGPGIESVPILLGDYFASYRVVGTTSQFFELLTYGKDAQHYEFAAGRNFHDHDPEHGYYEAVVGAEVARSEALELRSTLTMSHGGPGKGRHAEGFTVVGILASTGTPQDRAVFINKEGFLLINEHAKPVRPDMLAGWNTVARPDFGTAFVPPPEDARPRTIPGPRTPADGPKTIAAGARPAPEILVEQREVTAVLLRASPFWIIENQYEIGEEPTLQLVSPAQQIYLLFNLFVRPIQWVLLLLTGMILIVSSVSILVSIYNSMNDRRQQIAIMRALGASRMTVMTIILIESCFIAAGGGALGWVLGHAAGAAAGPFVERQTGVDVGLFDLAPPENLATFLGSGLSSLAEVTGQDGEANETFEGWAEWFYRNEEIKLGKLKIRWDVYPELLIVPGLMILAVLAGLIPAVSAYRTDVSRALNG